MVEGHGQDEWARTALVCAVLANANRDPKKHKPFSVDDFNPYAERGKRAGAILVTSKTIGLLREKFGVRKERKK